MSMNELYDKPGHLFRRMQQIAVAVFVEECANFDLTPPQYASLTGILENPGIDATRLSSIIFFDRATLGNVLERLETKGYIYRTGRSGDKRIKVLNLTDVGRKVLSDVTESVERAQKRMLDPLAPAEQKTLIELLQKLVRENDAVAEQMNADIAVPARGRAARQG